MSLSPLKQRFAVKQDGPDSSGQPARRPAPHPCGHPWCQPVGRQSANARKKTTRQRQRPVLWNLPRRTRGKGARPRCDRARGNLRWQEPGRPLLVWKSPRSSSHCLQRSSPRHPDPLILSTIETVSDEFGVPVLEDDVQEAGQKNGPRLSRKATKLHLEFAGRRWSP